MVLADDIFRYCILETRFKVLANSGTTMYKMTFLEAASSTS